MLNVPIFRQTDDSRCGPACIKMVLSYYGLEVTEDEVCERCNWTYELGCTDIQMKAAIESYGFKCHVKEDTTLEDLEYLVSIGVPVIVNWFSTDCGHSSIVVDIDEQGVYLLDPEIGDVRSFPRDVFLRVWLDWREDPYLQRCEDLILRQSLVLEQIANEKQK